MHRISDFEEIFQTVFADDKFLGFASSMKGHFQTLHFTNVQGRSIVLLVENTKRCPKFSKNLNEWVAEKNFILYHHDAKLDILDRRNMDLHFLKEENTRSMAQFKGFRFPNMKVLYYRATGQVLPSEYLRNKMSRNKNLFLADFCNRKGHATEYCCIISQTACAAIFIGKFLEKVPKDVHHTRYCGLCDKDLVVVEDGFPLDPWFTHNERVHNKGRGKRLVCQDCGEPKDNDTSERYWKQNHKCFQKKSQSSRSQREEYRGDPYEDDDYEKFQRPTVVTDAEGKEHLDWWVNM